MRINWSQIAVANESRYESPRGEVEGIHTLSTLRTKGLKYRRSTQSICQGSALTHQNVGLSCSITASAEILWLAWTVMGRGPGLAWPIELMMATRKARWRPATDPSTQQGGAPIPAEEGVPRRRHLWRNDRLTVRRFGRPGRRCWAEFWCLLSGGTISILFFESAFACFSARQIRLIGPIPVPEWRASIPGVASG
jgi:hypothetical protein